MAAARRRGRPAQLQIMYGLAGERQLPEREIPWLAGYEGSRPVRIGNAAHSQFQLDVYREIADAFHVARRYGIELARELLAGREGAARLSRIGMAAGG